MLQITTVLCGNKAKCRKYVANSTSQFSCFTFQSWHIFEVPQKCVVSNLSSKHPGSWGTHFPLPFGPVSLSYWAQTIFKSRQQQRHVPSCGAACELGPSGPLCSLHEITLAPKKLPQAYSWSGWKCMQYLTLPQISPSETVKEPCCYPGNKQNYAPSSR